MHELLNAQIVACDRCPRLRNWCAKVAHEKRRAYAGETYWARPVPNFGDPEGSGLIVGLAPGAHGANRTGRMFTGDRSGDFLFRALHRAELANQPTSKHARDGLRLSGVMITAVAHCAPPDNKLHPAEVNACALHLRETFTLRPWKAVLCLGAVAWSQTLRVLGEPGCGAFAHGAVCSLPSKAVLFGSYHPSQQNTFTGRLTEEMLDEVIAGFSEACR